MHVRRLWMVLGLLMLAVVPHASVYAQTGANDTAIQKAITYMRAQQAPDGTFAGFGAGSTADALYALASAGINASEFKNGGASATQGLVAATPEAVKDIGVAAKFVLAALLTGQEPRTLGGTNVVAVVQSGFDPIAEQYGKDTTSSALVVLALHAAGEMVQPKAVAKLEQLQLPDGGWSFDGTAATGSDTNTTAIVLQALIAVNGTADVRTRALGYIRTQQNADGGFPYSQTSQFGNASDANSTAVTIQAILAAGESLASWAKNGTTPLDRLLAFQNTSGAFRYQDATPDDNQLATYQAVPAVAGKSFPLEPLLIALPAAPAVATPTPTPAAALPPAPTPTPVAGGPVQLPDTGTPAEPMLALLAAALVVLALGLGLRRRNA